jgi:hypothetical protein
MMGGYPFAGEDSMTRIGVSLTAFLLASAVPAFAAPGDDTPAEVMRDCGGASLPRDQVSSCLERARVIDQSDPSAEMESLEAKLEQRVKAEPEDDVGPAPPPPDEGMDDDDAGRPGMGPDYQGPPDEDYGPDDQGPPQAAPDDDEPPIDDSEDGYDNSQPDSTYDQPDAPDDMGPPPPDDYEDDGQG